MRVKGELRGGVDLGGTNIQAVVVDDADVVLGTARRATPPAGGPPAVVAELAAALGDAAAAAGCSTSDLGGVGVGAPGPLDVDAGVLIRAVNLSDWDEPYPLGPELAALVGARVVLGNDVGAAVEAEFRLGAGAPYGSMLGVWWGTGVGGGVILDGRPWRGRGSAGEFGHTVVDLDGRREPSGTRLRGTVEAYAGRAAMEARARRLAKRGRKTILFEIMERKGKSRLASGVWAEALARDDPVAAELIDEAVRAIGVGIASVVNLLDLEAVIVGGGLGERLGQPYVDRMVAVMEPRLVQPDQPPAVHLAALGDLAGATGAALLVKNL